MVKAKTPTRNKKVPETISKKVSGFLDVGPDNKYFHMALQAANASITASRCIDVRARFIEGNGILDEQLAEMIVNRQGETLDGVLSQIADNVSAGEVIPCLVGYNGLAQTCSIRAVPFENIRYKVPDDLNNINKAGIFPYIDSSIWKNKATSEYTEINLFNPDPEVVLSQMATVGGIDNYPGQLAYIKFGKSGDGYYHYPRWMVAGINDIETERELSIYDYRTVSNGFSGSGFAVLIEEEKGNSTDEDDDDEDPTSDASDIESQLEGAMGNREAGVIPVLRFKNKEQADAFRFVETSGSQLSTRYEATSKRVAVKICTVFDVPLELANVGVPGSSLFSNPDEEKRTNQRMQASVNPYQRKIEQFFDKVFAHWHKPLPATDFTIENQNYFTDTEDATLAG